MLTGSRLSCGWMGQVKDDVVAFEVLSHGER
jgi:hypothetical protein